jgi:hypothetical protein
MRRWGKNLTSVTGNLAKCLRTSSSVNRGGRPRTNIRDDSIAVLILGNSEIKVDGRVNASKNLQVLHALAVGTSAHDGSALLALCVFRQQQQHFYHPAAANNRVIPPQQPGPLQQSTNKTHYNHFPNLRISFKLATWQARSQIRTSRTVGALCLYPVYRLERS